MISRLVTLAIGALLALASPAFAEQILFSNARILTMTEAGDIERGWLLVEGDTIVAMGEGDAPDRPDAKCIDGEGGTLIPGLFDMHVHYWDRAEGIVYLANGITAVRNLTGAIGLTRFDEAVRNGTLAGPRVYTSGPIIDGDKPIRPGGSVRVSNPDQAIGAVRSQSQSGYRAIKLYELLTPESYRAAVAEAKAAKMQIWSHTPAEMTVDELLDLEIDSLEHIDGMSDMVLRDDFDPAKVPFPWAEKWSQTDPARYAAVAARAAASKTAIVPTFALIDGHIASKDPDAYFARPEAAYLPSWAEAGWRSSIPTFLSKFQPTAEAERAGKVAFVSALREAGATLLIGTDPPNNFVALGFAIHDEFRAFADAGYSNAEIVRLATRGAADFLTLDTLGRLAPGASADLVLLAGDPRRDLGVLRSPEGVMVAGTWRGRGELDRLLAERAAQIAAEKAEARAKAAASSAEAEKPD